MKFFAFTTGLMISALATLNAGVDAQCQDPPMTSLFGMSNTEVGLGAQTVSMNYPGIENSVAGQPVTIKIFKEDEPDEILHQYDVTTEKEKPTVLQFGLKDLTFSSMDARYSAIICATVSEGEEPKCSPPSKPATPIDFGKGTLDCEEYDESVKDITIAKINEYSTQTEMIKQFSGGKATENKQHKLDGNNHVYWLSVDYLMTGYAGLFTVDKSKDPKKYCQRKYTLSVVTAFLEQDTNKILQKFRFTPLPLTGELIKTYITENTDSKMVPIVMNLRSKTDFAGKTINVMHSICTSAKDLAFGAVKCSEPFVQEWIVPTGEH